MSMPEDPETLDFTEHKKTDVPTQIMKIIQKYTSWETMIDFDKAADKYENEMYSETCTSDIKDVKKLLERMEKLQSDLMDYQRDCKKSLHDVVEETKHRFFDKFQGVQNMEAHNELDDEHWAAAILQERRPVNDKAHECQRCDCGFRLPSFSLASLAYGQPLYRRCTRPVVETNDGVEQRLEELYEELGTNRSKVHEAKNLCETLGTLCWKVECLITSLKHIVDQLEYQMGSEFGIVKRERERILREEQEARKLLKEKCQCLCDVMKEVLGDRVEDVVVSSGYSYSSCFMRDSESTDGKIMEINPHDHIIKDLRERVDADKNDFHVRNAALVLFNYAELSPKSSEHNDSW